MTCTEWLLQYAVATIATVLFVITVVVVLNTLLSKATTNTKEDK